MSLNAATGWEQIEFRSYILASIVLCLSYLLLLRKRRGKLPPGPRPLPLVGNLHQLDTKDLVKSLEALSRRFGPVFTVYLGRRPAVILYGYKAVKEALVEQAENFSGRGDFPAVQSFTQGNGIAFSNGEKWKVLRRFALVTLRNFGMGRRSMEERIQEEAHFLMEEFRRTKKTLFDPTFYLSRAVSNVICSVVFGNRFDYNDERFVALLSSLNDNFRLISSGWGMFYNIYPELMNFLPGPHNRIFQNFEKMKMRIQEIVKSHEETFQADCPRDLIDCFLIMIQREKGKPASEFNADTLVMSALNLFFGGTETVSTTLRYGLLILMKYPNVTERVRQEIDAVVGRSRCPSAEDRSRMPYTDAVIHEIQRFTSVIPLSLPHRVTEDTRFRGYDLPKGTDVIPVLTSVHSDPTMFKEPLKFSPQNFLDGNNRFKANDAFMPFSAGKRICLGEGLARMELFIFFSSILQNFNLEPMTPPDRIDLTPSISGVGNLPRAYQFRIVPR